MVEEFAKSGNLSRLGDGEKTEGRINQERCIFMNTFIYVDNIDYD